MTGTLTTNNLLQLDQVVFGASQNSLLVFLQLKCFLFELGAVLFIFFAIQDLVVWQNVFQDLTDCQYRQF